MDFKNLGTQIFNTWVNSFANSFDEMAANDSVSQLVDNEIKENNVELISEYGGWSDQISYDAFKIVFETICEKLLNTEPNKELVETCHSWLDNLIYERGENYPDEDLTQIKSVMSKIFDKHLSS